LFPDSTRMKTTTLLITSSTWLEIISIITTISQCLLTPLNLLSSCRTISPHLSLPLVLLLLHYYVPSKWAHCSTSPGRRSPYPNRSLRSSEDYAIPISRTGMLMTQLTLTPFPSKTL
jgi:hypothetical protein